MEGNTVKNDLPVKKNPMGRPVSLKQRIMIVNAYKTALQKNPKITIRGSRILISQQLGIGQRTISKVINEYNSHKTVTSPIKTCERKGYKDLYDELELNIVRRHVRSFWFNKTKPTLNKILQLINSDESIPNISRTNLQRLLKFMNFVYTKRGCKSALLEKDEIILWRRRYLESIRKYREEGRHLYYLAETWVNAGNCLSKTWIDNTIKSSRDAFLQGLTTGTPNPSDKGKQIMVLHIGSEDGFVPGGLLCLESKKTNKDYREEMKGNTFYEWLKGIIPRLKQNCVLIMDNAPCHSVKTEQIPNTSTRKADIIKWLEDKGKVIDRPMVITELLDMVKQIKPRYDKYVIDELAQTHNRTILRLPPYHCELNPIELAWSSVKNYVKMNNITYKLPDVKKLLLEGIERVDDTMWKNFIEHTKAEEENFYKIDFIVDEMLSTEVQPVRINIDDTSSDLEVTD
ncbi:uncharacterized protein LOC113560942 [Rhopalosiphum maidis]|uniref:uncharacterized protein LOC113560942 n=1 Tax=Rhopalosiphum maidis TaxID=43146 RepID=UPI000EFDFDCC|nr:uncharacterized protein LOC113560942 [Rhopalosiphum maidis]